jgi:hypothetical protein
MFTSNLALKGVSFKSQSKATECNGFTEHPVVGEVQQTWRQVNMCQQNNILVQIRPLISHGFKVLSPSAGLATR